MPALALDAEAFNSLARTTTRSPTVRAALRAAAELDRDVVVPAAVLAECYRGGGHDQAVDACLGREGGVRVVDTDRALARRIGNLLARAGRGSEHHVDGSVVATCSTEGGGVVLTGDPADLGSLAAVTVGVHIEAI